MLENIVCNYALSKGYEVSVGRVSELECDFVMRSPQLEYSYVQVALTIMASKETNRTLARTGDVDLLTP